MKSDGRIVRRGEDAGGACPAMSSGESATARNRLSGSDGVVVIVSTPEDPHAATVANALSALGHAPVWLSQGDIPGRAGHAFLFEEKDPERGAPVGIGNAEAPAAIGQRFGYPRWVWRMGDRDVLAGRRVRSIWLRRLTPVGTPDVHPEDAEFAKREIEVFLGNFWQVVGRGAFWVNPPEAFRRGERKALQLREASAAGLAIPATLIGNEPAAIRAFVRRHAGQDGVVYKAFLPYGWDGKDGRRHVIPTTPIGPDDLPDNDMLRAVPGIYQQRIAKRHEVRLTMFGDFPVAVRIPVEATVRNGELDWRTVPLGDLALEPCKVPEGVLSRVRNFMRRLDLAFGCFDFIVTPAGEWVFLEVNQMGQFLWVEARNPDIPMLAHFCAYLLAARRDFSGASPEIIERIRFRDHVPANAAETERQAVT
ncbi:MAG: hypothetical protein D6757_05070 [Alphaproteobacteria bacterium]|nr:MAG: hypothetical protein D6757_05070 [Alphaproteobacteria bacterium]